MTNPTDDNTYGYALRFWHPLPDGIHSCSAEWKGDVIHFKWKAATPKAHAEMSNRLFAVMESQRD